MSRKHKTEQIRDYPTHESDHKELHLSPTNTERNECSSDNASAICVKRFTCELCNEIFYESASLKAHSSEYHKLPLECTVCYQCDTSLNGDEDIGLLEVLGGAHLPQGQWLGAQCQTCSSYEDDGGSWVFTNDGTAVRLDRDGRIVQ